MPTYQEDLIVEAQEAVVSEQNPNYSVPSGTTVFEIDDYGAVNIGPNECIDPAQSRQRWIGNRYDPHTRRWFMQGGIRMGEVGDPTDLVQERAESDRYPAPSSGDWTGLKGILADTNLGAHYWRGWTAPDGGAAGATGGGFEGRSGMIYVKSAEDFFTTKVGADMYFATAGIGAAGASDRMMITANGAVGVLGANLTSGIMKQYAARGELWVSNQARFLGKIGFNGNTAQGKIAVTGSKAGNAALGSLLTALAAFGLITDATN